MADPRDLLANLISVHRSDMSDPTWLTHIELADLMLQALDIEGLHVTDRRYRHVGQFAPYGHDGCGWLGGVEVYVKTEDYDTHVNYSGDAFALYAENARLRTALHEAGNFACLTPEEDGEPCACCLHVSDLARAATESEPVKVWTARDAAPNGSTKARDRGEVGAETGGAGFTDGAPS